MALTRFGRLVAKGLSINVDYRQEPEESMQLAAHSIPSLDTFVETEPTAKEWLAKYQPTTGGALRYISSLFPFWSWIFHYNVQWLTGDVIAGERIPLY